jgi:hypothetical protein
MLDALARGGNDPEVFVHGMREGSRGDVSCARRMD